MNKPKFRINEQVILDCYSKPELNGDNYTIIDFVGVSDSQGEIKYKGQVFAKFKSNTNIYDIGLNNLIVAEPYLRKKHQPSEMNFNELMSSLNAPITTW